MSGSKTLFIGGIKSGKSLHAEQFALKNSKLPPVYLATTEFIDEEMHQRIEHHKLQRSENFLTVEEPMNLLEAIRPMKTLVLIECTTMWINNMLHHGFTYEDIKAHMQKLLELPHDIVFVQNDVGAGIIPDNALAREYIDISGKISQLLGQHCDRVFHVIAGISTQIKGEKRYKKVNSFTFFSFGTEVDVRSRTNEGIARSDLKTNTFAKEVKQIFKKGDLAVKTEQSNTDKEEKNSGYVRIVKGFALAMNMLTTLPFFRVHDFFKGINGYAVMFYPLVGFLLGGLLYGLSLILQPYLPSTHLHIILFALWVLLTGALHLDGLSDAIDALFVSKARAEEVMKDPHVGAMGMSFTGIFLILKASVLWHLEALWALPMILMFARFNTVLAIYFFAYIRKEGMSTLAKQEFIRAQLIFSALIVGITAFLFPAGLLLLLASLLSLLLFKVWFTSRFGGFSGDLYGFMIEGTELILLHVILVWSLI